MKYVRTLTCIAPFCTAVHAQEAPPINPSVEYTYEACDGTDDTGHNNTASLNGFVYCEPKGAIQGKHSMYFDGATTNSQTPNSAYFTIGSQVTYTVWLKLDVMGGMVFRKTYYGEDSRMFIDGVGHVGVGINPCLGNSNLYTTGTVTQGAWTFVSEVFDGVDIKLYLNGKLDSTYTGTTCQANAGPGTFWMGANYDNTNHLRGDIDDFRLYQAVLTDAQIMNIYKSTKGKHPPPPIAGTAPWQTSHTVNCQNVTQGTSVQIPPTEDGAWNCEKAGLAVKDGDEVTVTIDGTKK